MFYIFPLPGTVGDCCHFAAEKIVREKVSELIVQLRCKLMMELELGSNSRSCKPVWLQDGWALVFPGARSLVRWTHRVQGHVLPQCYESSTKGYVFTGFLSRYQMP